MGSEMCIRDRYNTDKIDNLGSVISPPYYNMAKEDKDALYDKSEYNSVRLFSGKKFESDTREENTFTRAKNYLDKWIEDGILVRDEEPVIYMYEQTIEMYDTHYSNTSFVALVELEEIGKGAIMPCEKPHEVSMLDRYELLKSTNADMSMISCLYVEPEKELFNLRFQNATNQLDNTARIKEVRRNIARIQTVITEKARA